MYRARVEGGNLGGCGVVLPYHCTGRGRLVHSNSIIYTLLNVYIWREREREREEREGERGREREKRERERERGRKEGEREGERERKEERKRGQ